MMKNYCFRLFRGYTIFILLSVVSFGAMGQGALPENFLGNWANADSGAWEYGFYEHGAITLADFWKYKSVKVAKKGTEIVLENGDRTLNLRVVQDKNGGIKIAKDGGKKETFLPCNGREIAAWKGEDTLSFSQPLAKFDIVTIRGYIRNMDQVKNPRMRNDTFTCSYNELLKNGNNPGTSVNIDSSGCFTVRFAVCAPQQVLLIWGRLFKTIVVEPGETIMLYADALDFIVRPNATREEVFNGKKDVLFMGTNARFHDEYSHVPFPLGMRSMDQLREITRTDMDFLRLAESDYQKSLMQFDSICKKNPNISKRCKEAITNDLKYRFAATLMQNRYNRGNNRTFHPDYMEYVNDHFSVNEPLVYFLTLEYIKFLRDYTGYVDSQKYTYVEGVGWIYPQENRTLKALGRLINEGVFSEITTEEFKTYEDISQKLRALLKQQNPDTNAMHDITRGKEELFSKLTNYCALPEVGDMAQVMAKEDELLLYDTLVSDALIKELCYAQSFIDDMEHDRIPLSPSMMKLVDARISNPLLKRKVNSTSAIYQKIADKQIAHEASLIDPAPFNQITDADSLWHALLAPYRGNVILVDFWGTWCEPCKNMLALMPPIEKTFQSERVIFMYIAFDSPEEPWKNVIREFNLTGNNIVHYNLSPAQQKLIIKKMKIEGFPTYKIVDKAGNVTNRVLKYPLRPQHVVDEIKAELQRP